MNISWKILGTAIPVALVIIVLGSANVLALEPTVVVLQYSVYPESFMPGDAGIVTITIRNSALATPIAEGTSSEQSTEADGSTDSHTQSSGGFYTTGSTQNTTTDQSSQSITEQSTLYYPMDANITLVRLHDTAQFSVESPDYENLGRIGPGDTVTFTFVVRASTDVSGGIYFMWFSLETDEPDVYTNYQIPLKVDDTSLRLILSNQPPVFGSTPGDLVFDVVNLRSSDVSMVYIKSQSDSFSFSPAEYYIGAMDSGEMFTAQLSATSNDAGAQQTASFKLHFKNGDNWHESDSLMLTLDTVSTQEPENMELLMPGLVIIAAVLIISIAYYAYRRSRRKKK